MMTGSQHGSVGVHQARGTRRIGLGQVDVALTGPNSRARSSSVCHGGQVAFANRGRGSSPIKPDSPVPRPRFAGVLRGLRRTHERVSCPHNVPGGLMPAVADQP